MMHQFREDYAAAVRENQMRKEEEEKKSRREMAKVAAEQVATVYQRELFSLSSIYTWHASI
jgi:hypothetical protein